jgi:hypothetical protein
MMGGTVSFQLGFGFLRMACWISVQRRQAARMALSFLASCGLRFHNIDGAAGQQFNRGGGALICGASRALRLNSSMRGTSCQQLQPVAHFPRLFAVRAERAVDHLLNPGVLSFQPGAAVAISRSSVLARCLPPFMRVSALSRSRKS